MHQLDALVVTTHHLLYMNEHSFVRSIHNALHPDVYKWKIHDTYTGGVPDAMYAGPAGLLFVEYKYVKTLPARDDTVIRHSLSALQCSWLERMKPSTNVALVLGVADTAIIIVDDFSTNICKSNYIEQSVSRKGVAQWIHAVTHSGGDVYENKRRISNNSKKSPQDLE